MKNKIQNRCEGSLNVYTRNVSYWWKLDQIELTGDMENVLEEDAENRAKEMISEGYFRGELCCNYVFPDGSDCCFWGWWEIEPD